jgi:thiosulfate/3-mercaptopyruvate sulfurtransferase
MPYTTLISTDDLAAHLDDPRWVVVDCRFTLGQTERGRQAYQQAHIAGAVYAHLDEDLSSPIVPGQTGRHPLPSVQAAAQTFGGWGIDGGTQVVAYDDSGGSQAARLWWMLRWLGHDQVAVLDGGWQRWQERGGPTRGGSETRQATTFTPQPRPQMVVDAATVLGLLDSPDFRIVDSRSAERYRGEQEPIDPVAGHIPSAVSGPSTAVLEADGRFRSPEALAEHFQTLLGPVAPDHAVFYCGSGVTAAHNLLALAHAGLGDALLYAGSWSDWITDPQRPIARG